MVRTPAYRRSISNAIGLEGEYGMAYTVLHIDIVLLLLSSLQRCNQSFQKVIGKRVEFFIGKLCLLRRSVFMRFWSRRFWVARMGQDTRVVRRGREESWL
jgi:hypothetical protein